MSRRRLPLELDGSRREFGKTKCRRGYVGIVGSALLLTTGTTTHTREGDSLEAPAALEGGYDHHSGHEYGYPKVRIVGQAISAF
ncbi:MAG: hypothetical protein JWP44_4963 [Mucilaginibacter sp.]|nr:hypothetical protein [Mucilaginibacter sp.]